MRRETGVSGQYPQAVNVDAAQMPVSAWWDDESVEWPLVLAIDSSSRTGSLAVLKGHTVVAEASWSAHGPGGSLHLDLATRLMADHGLRLSQVQGVVVATGPGSFTGTRAGISVGQGIAEALSIPLVGVPTLHGLVVQMTGYARVGDLACALIAAGRGGVYAWAAVVGAQRFGSCGDPVTATVQDVADALGAISSVSTGRVVIGGEIDAAQARIVLASVPEAVVLPPVVTQRRAAWLAALARPMLRGWHVQSGIGADGRDGETRWFPEDVQPHYLVKADEPRAPNLGWHYPNFAEALTPADSRE